MTPPLYRPYGVTVRELKEWLDKFLELEFDSLEEPTVWLETDEGSNVAVEICGSYTGSVFLSIRKEV
jgi:hypothetical protein